jgi:DNA primase
MIPDDVISQIRDAANIREVVGMHVQLKKAGRAWKGLCPFHGEKTPSFQVLEEKQFFHCFGCQKSGDVFSFVMEVEGKSFVEAAEQLAQRYGVAIPRVEESPELRKMRGERVAMLDVNKLATAFFRAQLAHPQRGEAARAYLAKRGVGDAITEKFQLGYAPADWHELTDHLREQRVDMELAVKVGLVRPQPRAGGFYDLFRDRLVCPVIVPGGDVVGFSARVIGKPPPAPDGSEPPKYVNSPESTVYKKSKLLFGLAQAREALAANKRCVLVEGNFDVITLHQAGFTDVVAPLGTALTPEQVGQLRRLTERVVLVYDGDKAGYRATMHALQTCVEADLEVSVAHRPGNAKSGGAGPLADGVDPDSLVAGGGAEQLREAIDRAVGAVEFFCFEVWGKARGNSDARSRAIEEAARLAAKVANPVKRDLISHTLATALEVDIAVVRNAVARASGQRPGEAGDRARYGQGPQNAQGPSGAPSGAPPEAPPAAPPPTDEVEVIALFADHASLIASPEADKAFWLLTDPRLRAMYSAAREGQSFQELVPLHLPTNTARDVLSAKYAATTDPSAQLAKMIAGLQFAASQRALEDLRKRMQEAQRRGDRELARQLASEISSHKKKVD